MEGKCLNKPRDCVTKPRNVLTCFLLIAKFFGSFSLLSHSESKQLSSEGCDEPRCENRHKNQTFNPNLRTIELKGIRFSLIPTTYL